MRKIVDKGRLECPVLLKWVGGKYYMSKDLIPMFPEHATYIEPFFGGGSVFFRKNKALYNVVNDINRDLINLYLCVANKDTLEKFRDYSKWLLSSRTLYDLADKVYLDKEMELEKVGKDYERAALYMFYMRSAFNGTHGAGFAVRKQYAQPWNHRILQVLDASHSKLDGAVIECMDFFKFVDKYEDVPNSFWYLDPPYVVADTKKYYEFNFNKQLHDDMLDCMVRLDKAGAKFMISYDAIDWLIEIYEEKGFICDFIECVYYSTGKKNQKVKEVKELIITNYKIKRSEEQIGLFNG
jgi:DNA adenine methylase